MGMITSLQYMHPKISNQKSVRRILSEVSQKNLVGIFHREGSCCHPNSYDLVFNLTVSVLEENSCEVLRRLILALMSRPMNLLKRIVNLCFRFM